MTEASDNFLAMIEDYLVQTDRYITENETRISRQEAVIAEWARTGRDTTKASKILRTMRDTLALMREHREYILREREQASQAPYSLPTQTLNAARRE